VLRLRFPVVLPLITLLAAPAGVAFDDAFKPLGGVWDVEGGPIVYVLDPAGSADLRDDDSELDALRDSFRAWACIEGTSLRFEEGDEPGPRAMALGDGQNTLFWDETGNDCLMGPGTLGITAGDVGGAVRQSADICFNGFHHTWGVGKDTDVQSIAMHEIGHMIGLDHPCDNDADTASCIPVGRAIMFPSWSGSPERQLLESDIAGAVGLYPANGDDAGCEGPFRAGERCTCNDECVEGLVCAPDAEGELRCGNTCSAQNRNCGGGSACVLDVPVDGGEAVGLCVRVAAPDLPPGAICATGPECASGVCGAVIALGSSICQAPCDGDGDCAGGSCFEGFCVGGFESEVCPDTAGGCGCVASEDPPGSAVGVAIPALLLLALRRRRRDP
jgi:MYXO-CTERM domain-containing protein